MDDTKFVLQPKKYNEETTVISLRIQKDMLRDLDAVANETGYTRNELMIKSMEFALKHMEIEEK